MQGAFLVFDIAFGQGTAHEGIFGVGDGGFDVLMVGLDGYLMAFADVLVHQSPTAVAPEVVGNLVTHFQHTAVGVALLDVLLQLVVVLQQFDAQEAGADMVAEAVFVQLSAQGGDVLFQFLAMVDVDMAGLGVAPFEHFYDFVEKVGDACTGPSCGGDDGHAQQGGELVYVQFVATPLQLVVHVQRHHHGDVHVD